MELTNFQKEVTKKIQFGEIDSIPKFIESYGEFLTEDEFNRIISHETYNQFVFKDVEAQKRFFNKFKEFISLLDKLLERKYIFLNYSNEDLRKFKQLIMLGGRDDYGEYSDISLLVNNILKTYNYDDRHFNIHPNADLDIFIKNKFQSDEEKNEKWKRRANYAVALIAFVSTAVNIYFMTSYSNVREVTITKDTSKPDTLKVLVIPNQKNNSQSDSSNTHIQ